jgi:hypothetical protein
MGPDCAIAWPENINVTQVHAASLVSDFIGSFIEFGSPLIVRVVRLGL